MTKQHLYLPTTVWHADSPPETPAFLAGPQLYYVTTIGGAVCGFGDEHLVGRMGGAWAHPLRLLHGWSLTLRDAAGIRQLDAADDCELYGSHLVRRFAVDGLAVGWTEFVAAGTLAAPALVGVVEIHNSAEAPWSGSIELRAELDLRGCWMSGWEAALPEASGETVLTYAAENGPYAGRSIALGAHPAVGWALADGVASADFPLALAADGRATIAFVLAAAHSGGRAAAGALAALLLDDVPALLAQTIAAHAGDGLPALVTGDDEIDAVWRMAQHNLQLLSASYADLPPYMLAGIPEYPQLFGCDTTYSVAGAAAAGFGPQIGAALRGLASFAQRACGRSPHEITTNGRVFHPGNAQETPQLAVGCWDYVRWTGDLAFLRDVYPVCVEGLEHFGWTLAGGPYPIGDGMVERLGMGDCKLDSVCYLYQGLRALCDMALALGHDADAQRFAAHAETLRERFERDWWLEDEQLYADSMHLDGVTQLDGHWTVVVPAHVGIAADERARRTIERIVSGGWVNEWGLVHTRGVEERVWTLPSGLLALTALRHGRADLGLSLLRGFAATARHGTLGLLKELIPIGICFVQLWSAALYAQIVVEGICGIVPLAHLDTISIDPRLPSHWPSVQLTDLAIGAQRLDLTIAAGSVTVHHRAGDRPLTVVYPSTGETGQIHPGQTWRAGEAK